MDRRTAAFVGGGLLITLILAGVISQYASSEPDGLERVAIDQGFADSAEDHALEDSPLAGYETDGLGDNGRGASGIIGVITTAVLVVAVLWVTRWGAGHLRRRPE